MTARPDRFQFGAAIATAVAFVILVGLGVWQLQRLQWKLAIVHHIQILRTAPAQPIAAVLERAAKGEDVEWTRVRAHCDQVPGEGEEPQDLRYALRDGKIVWRASTICAISGAPYGWIILDRGFAEATAGRMEAGTLKATPPAEVIGVLRHVPAKASGAAAYTRVPGGVAAAPIQLVAEHEDPAPAGITASALPEQITNNHLQYAITWFGLAAALVGVYLAMLLGRRRS